MRPQWKRSLALFFRRPGLTAAAAVVFALSCLLSQPAGGRGDNFQELLEKAKILKKSGQKLEALDLYRQAVKMRPTSSEAHDRLGFILYELGQFDPALKEMKEAVRLDPKNANAYHHMGSVYLRLNMITDAADSFRMALAIDPTKSCNCGPIERLIFAAPSRMGVMSPEEADKILNAPKPKTGERASKPAAESK